MKFTVSYASSLYGGKIPGCDAVILSLYGKQLANHFYYLTFLLPFQMLVTSVYAKHSQVFVTACFYLKFTGILHAVQNKLIDIP